MIFKDLNDLEWITFSYDDITCYKIIPSIEGNYFRFDNMNSYNVERESKEVFDLLREYQEEKIRFDERDVPMTPTEMLILAGFGLKLLHNGQLPHISMTRTEILNAFRTNKFDLRRSSIERLNIRNLITITGTRGTRYTLTERGNNYVKLFSHVLLLRPPNIISSSCSTTVLN